MQHILSTFSSPYVTAGLLFVNLLFLLLVLSLQLQVSRLRKNQKRLLTGVNGENIEAGLLRLFDELDASKERQAELKRDLDVLARRLSNSCGNLAVMRYNAFDDIGSDLSFSLALLDDHQNGVVITSIYGRQESRLYAKPVQGGTSPYHLTEEEAEVIRKATRS